MGDIYYRVDGNDLLDSEFASFASKKLDGLVGDDTCTFKNNSQNNGISARLIRGKPEELASNPELRKYPEYFSKAREFIKNRAGYDYFSAKITQSPPITCLTGVHEEFNDIEQSISDKLNEAFKTVETLE